MVSELAGPRALFVAMVVRESAGDNVGGKILEKRGGGDGEGRSGVDDETRGGHRDADGDVHGAVEGRGRKIIGRRERESEGIVRGDHGGRQPRWHTGVEDTRGAGDSCKGRKGAGAKIEKQQEWEVKEMKRERGT